MPCVHGTEPPCRRCARPWPRSTTPAPSPRDRRQPWPAARISRAPPPDSAAEVPRRGLAPGEAERIVRAEIAEREAAAAGYERTGHDGPAGRLRREAAVLASLVDQGARR